MKAWKSLYSVATISLNEILYLNVEENCLIAEYDWNISTAYVWKVTFYNRIYLYADFRDIT